MVNCVTLHHYAQNQDTVKYQVFKPLISLIKIISPPTSSSSYNTVSLWCLKLAFWNLFLFLLEVEKLIFHHSVIKQNNHNKITYVPDRRTEQISRWNKNENSSFYWHMGFLHISGGQVFFWNSAAGFNCRYTTWN